MGAGAKVPVTSNNLENMMRKIEKQMIDAIRNKTTWSKDNTRVEYQPEMSTPTRACIEYAKVYLFNNHIGTYVYSYKRFDRNWTTFKLWPTRTTKSRLNALEFV